MSLLEAIKKVEIVILGVSSISDKPKDHWKKYRKGHWEKYRTNWLGIIALANIFGSLVGFFLFKNEK